MALALVDIERGAMVRLVYDEDGQTKLRHQPLGYISRVKYQNKPDHIWSASGLAKENDKAALWVTFEEGAEARQVEPARLVLHKQANRAMQDALKNKDADEAARLLEAASAPAPILTDALRIGGKPPMTGEEKRKTK